MEKFSFSKNKQEVKSAVDPKELEEEIKRRALKEAEYDFSNGKTGYETIQDAYKKAEDKMSDPEFRKKIEDEMTPKIKISGHGEENFDGTRNGEYTEEDQAA